MAGLKRKLLAGESLFLTFFRCGAPTGRVAFSGPYPGKIIRMPLGNSAVLCQRDAFLCAAGPIDINIAFTKRLGAGFFGGEGFILQKLEGTGEVFIHSGGTIVPMELKQGEKVRVDTGCLVAFDPTVEYDIELAGGIKTALFGGEGLFLATMTGPGRVWLQTRPFSRLADRIIAAAPQLRGHGSHGIAGGVAGMGALGLLGGLMNDNDG